jgi:hypothetical protein
VRSPRLPLLLVVAAATVTACAGGDTTAPSTTVPAATSTTATTTTTLPPTTTTTPVTTTTTAPAPEGVLLLPSASEFGPAWYEAFVISYGPAEEELGTAPGGDGGSLDLGPEYGAQAPDGTWWFLDAAKLRLAHYSETASYLGSVAIPTGLLAQGLYFQYQIPRVLDDGTMVANNPTSGKILRLEGETLRAVDSADRFGLRYDDGTSLYGFAGEDSKVMTRVDPKSGFGETVDWFLTRAGTRFRIEVAANTLTADLPDAGGGTTLSLDMVYAGDPAVPAYGLIEVVSGADGTLFLYVLGATDSGVGGQLAGIFSISPDGTVSPIEPTRNPFSNSDPGSPAHLGIRAGSDQPYIMVVDTDGVHVYQRK